MWGSGKAPLHRDTAMMPIEQSTDRGGIFAGDDPFEIVRQWLTEAEKTEPNDANAMALATVDADGLPNTRVVLLKEVRDDAFVFFTNYNSIKAREIDASGRAAAVLHWKSLRRQVRFRGAVERISAAASDEYFATRSVFSRVGAWASDQSAPLDSRATLAQRAGEMARALGEDPGRPPHWGGYCIRPVEIEFWADGEARLHDRFSWRRQSPDESWHVTRLNP